MAFVAALANGTMTVFGEFPATRGAVERTVTVGTATVIMATAGVIFASHRSLGKGRQAHGETSLPWQGDARSWRPNWLVLRCGFHVAKGIWRSAN